MLEVVGPYVSLKKSGGTYMGRCPFHQEKTASFSVDPGRKLYYCFGCGEGGDVFSFIQSKEGLDFADVVAMLAEKYGVRLQYEKTDTRQEQQRLVRERLLALMEQAAAYYARVLKESKAAAPAREYLLKRGFGDKAIDEFRLGYSPAGGASLHKAATARGYTPAELEKAGLIGERQGRSYDRFRGRLMFPFTDHRGRVLGFGARVLDDSKPKYLNSPETELYSKGRLLFGLGNARQAVTREDRVYVVEGYTDVIALSQAGVANAVASMGTALTVNQLKEILRFTRNVYLAFDADAAGRRAMLRALEPARSLQMTIRVVEMPAGKDPADLVTAAGGVEEFEVLAGQARTLLEYQVQSILDETDPEDAAAKVRALGLLGQALAEANPAERNEQIEKIIDRFRLRFSPEDMAELMKPVMLPDLGEAGEEAQTRVRRILSREEMAERDFLSLCIARPGEAGRYLQDMTEAHFTTAAHRAAFQWIRQGAGGATSPAASTGTSLPADSPARVIMPELIIRAQSDQSSPGAMPELYFRLCEAEITRRINTLKEKSPEEDQAFQEINRLESQRRRIIDLIRTGSYE